MNNELITKFSTLTKEELEQQINIKRGMLFCAVQEDIELICEEIEALQYCLDAVDEK